MWMSLTLTIKGADTYLTPCSHLLKIILTSLKLTCNSIAMEALVPPINTQPSFGSSSSVKVTSDDLHKVDIASRCADTELLTISLLHWSFTETHERAFPTPIFYMLDILASQCQGSSFQPQTCFLQIIGDQANLSQYNGPSWIQRNFLLWDTVS